MLPRPHVLCYDKHGFIPWSQSTRLSREGALGPLSFISERQYIEQSTDNQQDQSAVNRTELQHTGDPEGISYSVFTEKLSYSHFCRFRTDKYTLMLEDFRLAIQSFDNPDQG